jgi:hypothetical protein
MACSGRRSVKLPSLSDPVLIRADGSFLYTFTSVVDDLELGITDVVRGEDHVTNTGSSSTSWRRSPAGIHGRSASPTCRC